MKNIEKSSSNNQQNNNDFIIVRLLPASLAESTYEDAPFCTCNYCSSQRQQQNKNDKNGRTKQQKKPQKTSSSSSSLSPTTVIHWDSTDLSLPPHDPESLVSNKRNLLLDNQLQAIHDHCFPLEYDDRFYNWLKYGMNHVIVLSMQKSGILEACEKEEEEYENQNQEDQQKEKELEEFRARLEALTTTNSTSSSANMISKSNLNGQSFKNNRIIDKITTNNNENNRRKFFPPKTGMKMIKEDFVDEMKGTTRFDSIFAQVLKSTLFSYSSYSCMASMNANSKNNDDENAVTKNSPFNSIYATRISPCLEGYDQIKGIAITRIVPPTKSKPLVASLFAGSQAVTPPAPSRESLGAICYIATLGVRDDSRGKGHATELIRRSLQECSGNFSGNVLFSWNQDENSIKKNPSPPVVAEEKEKLVVKNLNKNNGDDNDEQQEEKQKFNRSDACLFRCNRVFLHCLDTNLPALKLYANLRFEATDTLKNYYFLNGTWRDGIVLTRPIMNAEPTRLSLSGDSEYDLDGEEEDDEKLRLMARGEVVGEGPPLHWTMEALRVAALLTPAAVAAAMLL